MMTLERPYLKKMPLQSMISVGLSLCLLSAGQAKPKSRLKPAIVLGLESDVASDIAEKQVKPTIAFRASFSFLEMVRRELGRGLPIRWMSVYGRLQNDFDRDRLRTAVGFAAGFFVLHGELGWTQYTVKRTARSGPELLLGLGVVDVVGLYTRWAWLSYGQSVAELGLRVNYPLWVGEPY